MGAFGFGSMTQALCNSLQWNLSAVPNPHFSCSFTLWRSLPIHLLLARFFKPTCNEMSLEGLIFQAAFLHDEWVFHLLPIYNCMSEDEGPWYPSNRWVSLSHLPVLRSSLWNAARSVEQSWLLGRSSMKKKKESNFYVFIFIYLCERCARAHTHTQFPSAVVLLKCLHSWS